MKSSLLSGRREPNNRCPSSIRVRPGPPTNVANRNLTDRLFFGDPRNFRLWEVAGSSHFDFYGLAIGPTDIGDGQGAVANLAATHNPTSRPPGGFTCNLPINTGGTHSVLEDAFQWLNRWVVTGTRPPQAPFLQTTQASPVVFALDASAPQVTRGNTPSQERSLPTSGIVTTGRGTCAPRVRGVTRREVL